MKSDTIGFHGPIIVGPLHRVNATRPRFTIKHHLLRYAHRSSLRRTGMYASVLTISQALHLTLAGEPGNLQTAWFWCRSQRLTVDLDSGITLDLEMDIG